MYYNITGNSSEIPTMKLRWVERRTIPDTASQPYKTINVLQQCWEIEEYDTDGILVGQYSEWRDIPYHMGEEK